ncbi:MAG: hypothetical protein SH850_21025 [Planctomycetaceae bacterium]|nr:hypothetical protein [Planctomycetaceae bacterium]
MPKSANPTTELVKRRQQDTVKQLREYYHLGQQINRIVQQQSCTMNEAIEQLGWKESRFTAYKAREFAEWSDEDVSDITGENRQGPPLSWSHVVVLLTVSQRRRRKRLIKKAVKKEWSAARLRTEIRPITDRSNSGRRFGEAHSSEDVIQALNRYLKRPLRYLQQILADDNPVDLEPGDRQRFKRLRTAIKALATPQ